MKGGNNVMDPVLAGLLRGSAVLLGAWVVAVEVTDLTSLPSLLGYGVLGPAMFWAYRTVSRANTDSKEEAWTIVRRLQAENVRLSKRIEEILGDKKDT